MVKNENGWILSPAYDINPVAYGCGTLTLNISKNDNTQDLKLALEVAQYFRIGTENANQIMNEVIKSVKDWRNIAKSFGLSTTEQNKMADAFVIADEF